MTNGDVKNKAISGMFWKLVEKIGAQLVSTVVSIILARLLMPEDYSIVSIVAIFFAFCNIFVTSGLGTGLVQQKDVDEIDYSSVLYANLGIATILYVIIFFAAPYISELYSKPILIPVFRVMGINFFAYLSNSVVSAKVSRTLEFKNCFFATLVGTIASAVVGIVMAFKGMGVWALVAQQSVNAFVGVIMLALVTRIKFVFKFSFKRLKPIFKFSWKVFVTNLVGTIYADLKPLIVGLKYSTIDLAYFNKGENFPRTISSAIDGTLSSVLFPVVTKLGEDKEMRLNVIRRFFKTSSYLIFPAMMGLMAVTNNFVDVVLTSKWLPIAPYFKIFCIYYMLYFITLGCGQIYKAVGRSDVLLKLELVKKVISVVILFFFVLFSPDVVIFAVANIATIFMVLIADSIVMRKYVGYKLKYQILDFLPNFIISIIMYVPVYLIDKLDLNIYFELIIQVVVGLVTYLLLSIITKNENSIYFFNFAKDFIGNKIKKRRNV